LKTFEQYIREAVDFRLGGKLRKGIDSEIGKSFGELKIKDKVWYYKFEGLDPKKVVASGDGEITGIEVDEVKGKKYLNLDVKMNVIDKQWSFTKSSNEWMLGISGDEIEGSVYPFHIAEGPRTYYSIMSTYEMTAADAFRKIVEILDL